MIRRLQASLRHNIWEFRYCAKELVVDEMNAVQFSTELTKLLSINYVRITFSYMILSLASFCKRLNGAFYRIFEQSSFLNNNFSGRIPTKREHRSKNTRLVCGLSIYVSVTKATARAVRGS